MNEVPVRVPLELRNALGDNEPLIRLDGNRAGLARWRGRDLVLVPECANSFVLRLAREAQKRLRTLP